MPKASKGQEAEEYQPVMQFDFKIDTNFDIEQEEDEKMALPRGNGM